MNQDILIEILSHLPLKDKLNSSLVCKEWYHLNKYIYKNQIVDASIKTIQSKTFLEWFEKYKCLIKIHDTYDVPKHMYKYIVNMYLGKNHLTELPETIGELKNLQILNLRVN